MGFGLRADKFKKPKVAGSNPTLKIQHHYLLSDFNET